MQGIFKKDLYEHDESSNSVVAANLTRKFFPAMIRTNPLYEEQGIWMEGPYWQHIPPLFAYVPLPLFWIDGHVTIEMKRVAYDLVLLATGYVFILGVYLYDRKRLSLFAATLASIFFVASAFSQNLVSGAYFGTSDIVLAFTIVCSFAALLWYLRNDREARKSYSNKNLAWIGAIVSLPILTKNVLGAIPAATYLILLLWDHRRVNRKIFAAAGVFLGMLVLYYGALYLSSPAAFKAEILLPLAHTQPDFEGWGRPWYFFFTDYLPKEYFLSWTYPFLIGLLVGIFLLVQRKLEVKTARLLALSGIWFVWNLAAISTVSSKVPNFAYQSFVFAIFFAIYSAAIAVLLLLPDLKSFCDSLLEKDFFKRFTAAAFLILLVLTTYSSSHVITKFRETRAAGYYYTTEHEKFYHFGEFAAQSGVTNKDLIIFNATIDDCWFRYYTLFLTGAESRTLDEIYNIADVNQIKPKYQNVYFVINKTTAAPSVSDAYFKEDFGDYTVFKFKSENITPNFIADLKNQILDPLNILVNQANRSCEWLMQSEDLFHKYH